MLYTEQRREDCCGCTVCTRICPRSAISMEQDEQGFFYPCVDQERCIHCGLCKKVCPMQADLSGIEVEPETYAIRSKDASIRKESSSGGVFSSVIDWSLNRSGTVYGAAFDESFQVRHMRAESEAECEKFRTSKYVDSDLMDILPELEKDLNEGKYIVLSGRPCQICAVNKYLDLKRINKDKLLTCDIICHGVPSRRIWEDYLSVIKQKYMKQDDTISFISMRSKRRSWKKQVIEIRTKKGLDQTILDDFSFNRFYLSLLGHRPSCFPCPFTSYVRMGDITLGDFWNVENAGVQFDTDEGINAVLVNTVKGKSAIMDFVLPNTENQRVSKKAVWQPYLEYSANAPGKYADFWKEYLSADSCDATETVLRRYMEGTFLTRVIHLVSPVLQKTGLYTAAGKIYKFIFARK